MQNETEFMGEDAGEPNMDWVPVASAGSIGESLCLIAALEEVEIPCRTEGEGLVSALSLGGAEQRIMAPRAMAQRAQEVIAAARQKAEFEGVRQAFTEEAVEEQLEGPFYDMTTRQMISLLDAEPEERAEALAEHLADWLAQGIPLTRISEYLAVAGLDRAQAKVLMREVKTTEIRRLQAARRRHVGYAISMAAAGLLMFSFAFINIFAQGASPSVSTQFTDRPGILGCVLLVLGLGLAYRAATRKLPDFPEWPEDQDDGSDAVPLAPDAKHTLG